MERVVPVMDSAIVVYNEVINTFSKKAFPGGRTVGSRGTCKAVTLGTYTKLQPVKYQPDHIIDSLGLLPLKL